MGVLGGKCADVELAWGGGWGWVMRNYCCFCGLGGRGGNAVFIVCGSVGIVEVSKIREGVIIRWGGLQ